MKYLAPSTILITTLLSGTVSAAIIDIQELALFNYSDSIGTVLEHDEIGYDYSDFSDYGLTVEFENNLDSNNLGSFAWTVTNNGSESIFGMHTSVFWDAELSQYDNSFSNESGEYLGNTEAVSWEIDEPGNTSGDLVWNMLDYAKGDNTNALEGTEDDVAFSLGFFLEKLDIGEFFELTFQVSESNIGGLRHFDENSNEEYFFNGFLTYVSNVDVAAPSEVPEPASFALFLLGIAALYRVRRTSN
ncbi:PEP-CTERM sorting domain-containing protein [Reinekea marina]|uniref:PEP-CTERM sorting domain-containing protein n=1 Tax=Reinekea marina TaxID=1310421 RepID=A0ABV7WUD3_9GAMM|nr:PEP-CTERM sorting domain-containing protein [Reinekea marina]MDN3648049.1 PEP-CTERM sorting domain-containing protein [Reinekea marina]